MKKIIAVYRMGKSEIVREENEVIDSIIAYDNGGAGTLPMPTGMLHFFVTTMTPHKIKEFFIAAETKLNQLPIIVFDIHSDDTAFHFDSIMPFKLRITEFKEEYEWEDDYDDGVDDDVEEVSIDFLLDKVRKEGLEGLTEMEKIQLDKLSKL